MIDPVVKNVDVRMVAQKCEACQSTDPAPMQWQKGNLSVTHVWNKLGIDVTHVGNQLYLAIINCVPSCFAIWQLLHQQDPASIICQLESIFYDRGPPAKILRDNSVAFSSEQFLQFLRKWGVWLRFWCAIVERSHWSIKVIAARKRCLIPEVVYW